MSSIQKRVGKLVKLFHHYQEALASDFDVRQAKKCAFLGANSAERAQIEDRAARLALLELASTSARGRAKSRILRKTGEAEWVAELRAKQLGSRGLRSAGLTGNRLVRNSKSRSTGSSLRPPPAPHTQARTVVWEITSVPNDDRLSLWHWGLYLFGF